MRRCRLFFEAVILLVFVIPVSGAMTFQSVSQPRTVLPDETVTVVVEVIGRRGRGQADSGSSTPYLGICLPQGWTILNDTASCTGSYEALLRYDVALSLEQEMVSPAPAGYSWWVGRGEAAGAGEGSTFIDIRIQTDDQVGLFSIDYMLGDSQDGVNQERSNDHGIEVLSDDQAPGGMRAVVAGDTVCLSWGAPPNSEGLVAYVVYRDDEVISTSFVVQTSYVDDSPPDGLHRYTVAAFYSNGDVYFATEVQLDVFLNAGGTGTRQDPFLLATASHLMALGRHRNLMDRHFRLVSDIDLDPNLLGQRSLTGAVIARDISDTREGFQGRPFNGVFDGSDHTISNLTITGDSYLGLFGALGPEAQVINLNMIDVDVMGYGRNVGSIAGYNAGTVRDCYSNGLLAGDSATGGLVGFSDNATIIACHSDADVLGSESIGGLVGLHSANDRYTGAIRDSFATGSVLGWDSVGGLVGANFGDVFNCTSTGFISGDRYVGGLIGGHYQGRVRDCDSSARVSGGWYIGGLIGANMSNVVKCFSTGSVYGDVYVGGIIGHNDTGALNNSYSRSRVQGGDIVGGLVGASTGSIQFTYCSGPVSGDSEVGGLVGQSDTEESIHGSFWDMDVSGQSASAGGIGLTTAELQDLSRYIDAGWDFAGESENGTENIWYLTTEGYAGFFSFAGSGTEANPYLVETVWHLTSIDSDPNMLDKYFRLTADIDLDPNQLGSRVFTHAVIAPDVNLANDDYDGIPFSGVFDGCRHEIRNLNIVGSGHLGLFGSLASNGDVSNLHVVMGHIEGSELDSQGILVGENEGQVTNCYSSGFISGSGYGTGGLIGINYGEVRYCTNAADVNGYRYVGGLVGGNYAGQVSDCHSTGAVSGTGYAVGGLVGENSAFVVKSNCTGAVAGETSRVGGLLGWNCCNGSLEKCYSTGAVVGNRQVGGLVGKNEHGSVSECYSIGLVTGNEEVGGLLGWNDWSITHSFWNVDTSGQTESAGGFGMTTAQMQDVDTYLNAGWDFFPQEINGDEDIWIMDIYPVHYLVQIPGEGTQEDPYLISKGNKYAVVMNIGESSSAHYRLTEDIDLSAIEWSGSVFPHFSGTFDGGGFTIHNFKLSGGSDVGLFGIVESSALIMNLNVVDADVQGTGGQIGILAGVNEGHIISCSSTGSLSCGQRKHQGGLVGRNLNRIEQCFSNCTLSGDSVDGAVGGLAGGNNGIIASCYSTGTIHLYIGRQHCGGLVGFNQGSIDSSYSTTRVVANTRGSGGGLVGGGKGEVQDCFWDIETSGQTVSWDGTGLTTAEMQTASTFLAVGWDFVDETDNGTEDIWWIDEGEDYPRLWWELIPEN